MPKAAAHQRRAGSEAGSDPGQAEELPFDGRHILELHGLSAADTTNHLETFLAGLNKGPVEPAVRLACPLILTFLLIQFSTHFQHG